MKLFNKKNISNELNKPGTYNFYDKTRVLIYIGSSKIIKHRLQSYYQKDDFREHKSKKAIRGQIKYYSINYSTKRRAITSEKKLIKKHKPKHNHTS